MAVDLILEEISKALVEDGGGDQGFGSFSVRTRKPRSTKTRKPGKS